MDALLEFIDISKIPTNEHLRAVYKTLSSASTITLASYTSTNIDPLELLQPNHHTLAYVCILNARMAVASSSVYGRLLAFAYKLALEFNPLQLRIASHALVQLGESISQCAISSGHPPAAIRIFSLLCTKLNSTTFTAESNINSVHLTPLHVLLLKHCLLSKNYKAGHEALKVEITDMASPIAPIRIQDFMLYHYYGGLIHIGNKHFTCAMQFFELCLGVPSDIPSAIQIEAYKRFILVSLLANGALLLPKTVSPVVARVCKSLTLQYAEFATAYSSHSLARATTKASQYASKFETDKTNGLVHQCLADLVRRKIRKLTDTYLTLSLGDITRAVGLNELDVMTGSESTLEAEAHVVRMIDDRQILATISHLDGGMVSFHDVFNGLDTLSTTATLEDQIATLMARDTDAQILDRKIGLSQNYLQKTIQDKARPLMNTEDETKKGAWNA
ncbi:hypothetical protein BDV3_003178 [Batrachochytrium dendrobatidis]|nr:hypothetical protein O5D80_002412 [Batrachochytrium dendrobatidis]KAK5666852.1 hypothetical protein QVD99_006486 [Batrachochytrium dendrobatidis]